MALHAVIATFNRRPILEQTLDALDRQTRRDFRVVVVDDGSTDDTWTFLEARRRHRGVEPELVIERQDNRGQGMARNRALRHVDGGVVAFLGDDVLPRPDFVAAHLAAHAETEAPRGVVGFTDWCRGAMRVTPLLEMIQREGHQFGYAHMTPCAEVPFTCFYTSNASLPRQVLGEEPFDPTFRAYGWEDVELGYRLHRQGLKLVYRPEAAAEHLHPMDLPFVFDRQRAVGRGLHQLLELHPELEGSPLLAPSDPPRWFAAGRRLVPRLVPLLSRVDRTGVPLPKGVWHRILMCGFYLGREEASRRRNPALRCRDS